MNIIIMAEMNQHDIDNLCNSLLNDENPDLDMISSKSGKDKEYIKKRTNEIKKYKYQLNKLIEKPIIKQRTEEWYTARKNIVTASDFAQALGKGKFGSTKQFYKKKCGIDDFVSNEYVKWGNMFEDVASSIYKKMYNVEIYEFGLIKDEEINFFGASPDGISSNGIMIEIKCPKKREITGDIPLQYYYQIMGQLKVCELDECDYFELDFKEIFDENEFIMEDSYDFMGIIIETSDSIYEYSKLDDTKEDMIKWSDGFKDYNKKTYWYLNNFNIKRIIRDDEFIKENITKLETVWNKVLNYRNDPDLFKKEIDTPVKKRTYKDRDQIVGYSFIEE